MARTRPGSTFQNAFVEQVSNIVADPAQCRVNYHWKMWKGGAVTLTKMPGFFCPL